MRNILFEYKKTPLSGFIGRPGGSSVVVFSDGSIVYRSFVFGREEPEAETKVAFMPEIAARIEKVLIAHKDDLAKISDNLHNGTMDGSHDCFQFGEKTISSWTIHRHDLNKVLQHNPNYYNKYKECMIQENMVLDIYNEIVDIMDEFHLGLWLKKM